MYKWFLWHSGLLEEAQQYKVHEEGLSIHSYEMEVFRKRANYIEDLVARIEAGVPVINFLRCPYSRAFSSYMHLHSRFYIRFERDGIRNAGLELRYAILRSIYGFQPPVEYPISFTDYLNWLDTHDISEIEPHHAMQHTALYDLPGVVHYRLEDFEKVIPKLEHEFMLADSSAARTQFSSSHHIQKSPVDSQALMKLLERGVSLSRSPNYFIPEVRRDSLVGTSVGNLIERIFHADIALYESIE